MKKIMTIAGIILLAALFMASPASAALTTYDITFTATNFTTTNPDATPPSEVKGEFVVSLDPTQIYPDTTNGITLKSLNIALGSQLGFNYYSNRTLEVGGLENGVGSTAARTDDFSLVIENFAAGNNPPIFFYFLCTSSTQAAYFSAQSLTGTITPVPLPPAVLLLGSGLLSLAGWRRVRKA